MDDNGEEAMNRRACLAAAIPAMALGFVQPAIAQNRDGRTFAAIRRGKYKPGAAEEFAKRVRTGALPILTAIAGFKAYYLMFGADDTVMSITLVASKAAAEEANQKVLP